jgi:hypothetical protein
MDRASPLHQPRPRIQGKRLTRNFFVATICFGVLARVLPRLLEQLPCYQYPPDLARAGANPAGDRFSHRAALAPPRDDGRRQENPPNCHLPG